MHQLHRWCTVDSGVHRGETRRITEWFHRGLGRTSEAANAVDSQERPGPQPDGSRCHCMAVRRREPTSGRRHRSRCRYRSNSLRSSRSTRHGHHDCIGDLRLCRCPHLLPDSGPPPSNDPLIPTHRVTSPPSASSGVATLRGGGPAEHDGESTWMFVKFPSRRPPRTASTS